MSIYTCHQCNQLKDDDNDPCHNIPGDDFHCVCPECYEEWEDEQEYLYDPDIDED